MRRFNVGGRKTKTLPTADQKKPTRRNCSSPGKVNCNQPQMTNKGSRRKRKRESRKAKLSWRSPPLRFPAATKRRRGCDRVTIRCSAKLGRHAAQRLVCVSSPCTFVSKCLGLPVVCDSCVDSVTGSGTTSCQDACCVHHRRHTMLHSRHCSQTTASISHRAQPEHRAQFVAAEHWPAKQLISGRAVAFFFTFSCWSPNPS